MDNIRPDWDVYFADIAVAVAARADCSRRRAGAVIVRDHRIISTGYAGAPRGAPGCLEGACPRGKHYEVDRGKRCGCGGKWPCRDAADPGSSYDTGPGACISIHAEQNAIIYADYDKCQGASMYVTDFPCGGCWKMIKGAGLYHVFWPEGRWDNPG